MKQLIAVLLTALVLFSCKEDDETGSNNPNSVAIGGKIYTIEQGADQSGSKGQYLDEYIKIGVTDFEGNPVNVTLNFELSSEEGSVVQVSPSEEEDEEHWLIYAWKLGCTDAVQTLTITVNECGVSRDGCVDVTVFELTVNADEPTSGWVEACYQFSYSDINRFVVNNGELLAYTDYGLYVTEDVSYDSWSGRSTSEYLDYNDEVWHFGNGSMIIEGDYYPYISENNGREWKALNTPGSYYYTKRIVVLDDNSLLAIVNNYSAVYMSTDGGSNWSSIISDIQDETGTNSYVRSIASEGNKAYIITDDYKVIEYHDGTTKVHEFANGSWDATSMENFYVTAENNKIILVHSYSNDYNVRVLDMTTDQLESVRELDAAYRVIRDLDDLYLIPRFASNTYYRYNGKSFDMMDFDLPDQGDYGFYGQVTVFKGSPVFYSSQSNQLYFYKD